MPARSYIQQGTRGLASGVVGGVLGLDGGSPGAGTATFGVSSAAV